MNFIEKRVEYVRTASKAKWPFLWCAADIGCLSSFKFFPEICNNLLNSITRSYSTLFYLIPDIVLALFLILSEQI